MPNTFLLKPKTLNDKKNKGNSQTGITAIKMNGLKLKDFSIDRSGKELICDFTQV